MNHQSLSKLCFLSLASTSPLNARRVCAFRTRRGTILICHLTPPAGYFRSFPLFSPLYHAGSKLPLRALPLVAALTRHETTPFTSGKELAAPSCIVLVQESSRS
jgi:hypothetical protein